MIMKSVVFVEEGAHISNYLYTARRVAEKCDTFFECDEKNYSLCILFTKLT